jgi:hypothetical protein
MSEIRQDFTRGSESLCGIRRGKVRTAGPAREVIQVDVLDVERSAA